MDLWSCSENLSKRGNQVVLHGSAIGLALPSGESAAVVGDS
jgi:hypothetical protein